MTISPDAPAPSRPWKNPAAWVALVGSLALLIPQLGEALKENPIETATAISGGFAFVAWIVSLIKKLFFSSPSAETTERGTDHSPGASDSTETQNTGGVPPDSPASGVALFLLFACFFLTSCGMAIHYDKEDGEAVLTKDGQPVVTVKQAPKVTPNK